LCVTDAEVELLGTAGMRRVGINGFYRGYKVKDLKPDEIITRVLLPLPAASPAPFSRVSEKRAGPHPARFSETRLNGEDEGGDELLNLYKVSRRQDLDIATVGAAVRVRRAGAVITRAYLAFSGVAPTVVRLPATEAFLQGKRFEEATFREAGRLACEEIEPISDVRGTRRFRLQLVENLMLKFYFDCPRHAEPATVG
jgi:CO/xanthine dehydrogenase FAD-binding subunit